jgi:hypothetical protein
MELKFGKELCVKRFQSFLESRGHRLDVVLPWHLRLDLTNQYPQEPCDEFVALAETQMPEFSFPQFHATLEKCHTLSDIIKFTLCSPEPVTVRTSTTPESPDGIDPPPAVELSQRTSEVAAQAKTRQTTRSKEYKKKDSKSRSPTPSSKSTSIDPKWKRTRGRSMPRVRTGGKLAK